jgi:filamentous hemagglutinin family protein
MKIKLLAVHIGLVLSSSVFAEGIATDGTMGAAQPLTGTNVEISQTLGKTAGNNLFHSFSDFNINQGQTVTFTNTSNVNYQNVISRVTGDNKSIIDGTLQSKVGNADFYFINPNGITFNANASVDVPAAFHVTTADKMDFAKNGGVFYANLNNKSTLSSESPAALGFLGTSKVNNGLLKFDGANISLNKVQTMDMVAGNISVENNANLQSEAGEVRLVAMQDKGVISLEKTPSSQLLLPDAIPLITNAGNISIKASSIDTTGDGGGRIAFWGNEILLKGNDSYILANNSGDTDALPTKTIEIYSNLLTIDGSDIKSESIGKITNKLLEQTGIKYWESISFYLSSMPHDVVAYRGKSGNVDIRTKTFNMLNDSLISTTTYTNGDAGDISISSESFVMNHSSAIDLNAVGTGNGAGGNIAVNANSIKLNDISFISNFSQTNKNAGDITLNAKKIDILYGAGILSSSWAKSGNVGNAGNITLVADDLRLDSMGDSNDSRTFIHSNTIGSGNGGDITIKAKNITLTDDSRITALSGQYGSHNKGGNAGSIYIVADDLTLTSLDGQGNPIISSTNYNGNAGNIVLNVKNLLLNPTSIISSEGNIGDIKITANDIKLIGGNIDTTGTNSSIKIDTKTLYMSYAEIPFLDSFIINDPARIMADTYSEFSSAGNIIINSDITNIDGKNYKNSDGDTTGITANSHGFANSGSVIINSDLLNLSNLARISANTFSKGKAGDAIVNSKNMNISNGSDISSASIGGESSGKTGHVIISANDSLNMASGGKISIENQGNLESKEVGNIDVTSPDITMKNAEITSHSTGNTPSGNINVHFANRLNMKNSFINTTANTGDGGAINVNGGDVIYLKNSGFKTTVSGENSNGGDISVKAPILVMDTGLIQANAVSGNGGNINLALQALIPSANQLLKGGKSVDWDKSPSNVIQAASQSGVSGTVNNSAPQMNLSGVLANIGNNNFDNRLVSQDYCAIGKGSSLSKKGKGGLPLRAKDLQVY